MGHKTACTAAIIFQLFLTLYSYYNSNEVEMKWSKPLVSVVLFLISVSTENSSLTIRKKKNTGWLQENFEAERMKLKKKHIFNRIKLYGTNDPFSMSSKELNMNIPSTRRDAKKTIIQHGEINRKLPKNEANLSEFLNTKKRANRPKIALIHHISKRNINISKRLTTQNVTSTTKPSVSSFTIPPECSGETSCSGRCIGNIPEWRNDETLSCYCDTACYEIFNDCCSDYIKYCGEQKPSNISIKEFKWTCEPLGHFTSNKHCEIGEGVWMVSRCANDWPYDKIRRHCENPAKFPQKPLKFEFYIPVTSGNVTFRNYFCAQCNHITGKFDFFPVEIKTNVIPPGHYNFKRKVEFLLSHGVEFPEDGTWTPKSSQKRRYCLKSIVDSCPGNTTSDACKNGPVEPVSRIESFKNHHCALCNDPNGYYSCFPPTLPSFCYSTPPQRFLLNLDYQWKSSIFSVLKTSCSSKGLTFDDKLQECVQDLPPPSGNEGKILVLAWFDSRKNFHFSENDFKTVMKQYFGVEHSQIYNVTIDTVSKKSWFQSSVMLFISSTLQLTPEQLFDIVFENDSKSSTLNLRSFILFKKPLNVSLNNITFTIIKTTSRPLSCNTRINRCTREKIIFDKVGYDRKVYSNKTMCKEDHSSKLNQIKLSRKNFVINANLSIYHKFTGLLYELGQYDVTGDSIVLCNLKQFNISTFLGKNSCKGRCSNQTEWRTKVKMRCSCKPDCYKVFNNCCSDYTKYCRAQISRKMLGEKYNYICEEFAVYASRVGTTSARLWMVTQCRPEWSDDTSPTKFDVPASKLNMSSQDPLFIPVVGHDNTTFRSLYSAVCNTSYENKRRPVDTNTYYVIPPEYFNFTEKMRFLLSHADNFSKQWQRLTSGENQTKQYCLRKFIDSCPLGEKFESWDNGNVAVLKVGQRYYKNTQCALCKSWPRQIFLCFSGKYLLINLDRNKKVTFLKVALSLQYDVNNPIERTQDLVYMYDEAGIDFMSIRNALELEYNIRKSLYLIVEPQDVAYEVSSYANVINAWLEPLQNSQNTSFTPSEFKESLTKYLNISESQLTEINVKAVLRPETISPFLYLVSSTILLTSQQRSELTNQSEKTSAKTKLHNYIYYSEPFILQIKGLSYTVTKTMPRPLVCVKKRTYTPEEYTLQEHDRVLIRGTNKTYGKFQYYKENVEKLGEKTGNITVCEKYTPTKCNGSTVLYTVDEYIMMVNLSIFVKKTSRLYDYGEYEILSNKSVTICQYFKKHMITETIRDDGVLDYITYVLFLLSILFLIFLLVTYILFPQLQTLPGKNLMNFSTSLLLFKIGWLLLNINEIRSDEPPCTAMAVIEHYFLMASFVSMSVIAFHTCKVFARRLPAPKMSEGHERKLFCVYLALVWLLPGLFVGICVLLDDQDVVKIGYGEFQICWLTEDNAYIYFVIIPIAVLLSFNVIAFVTAAIYLRKHSQNSAARQASGNRRSKFLIYVKLSTLMGFAWLFGLLALVVKSTTVFWYFFVIFVSLQGVFVATAFVLNTKTFVLYKQWYKSGSRTPKTNCQRRSGPTKV